VDHHVGAHAAGVAIRGDLFGEVAALQHSGHLHHPAELELAPTAAGLRAAQGRHQATGLLLELVVGGGQLLHLLGQRRIRPHAFALELLHPLVVLPELLGDGRQQVLDGLLAQGEVTFGRLA